MRIFILLFSFFLTFISLSQELPNGVSSEGLIGWWPFSGNANDYSLNSNDGVVGDAQLTEDRLGNTDAAYNFFGGDNDVITINTSSSLSLLNSSTIFLYSLAAFFSAMVCK